MTPTQTVVGSPAVFYNALAGNVVSLIADINPIQSGTGDPTPSNFRPVETQDSLVLYVNGNDQTISFGHNVYGGRMDITQGRLWYWRETDLGSIDWSYDSSSRTFVSSQPVQHLWVSNPSNGNTTHPVVCPIYQPASGYVPVMPGTIDRWNNVPNFTIGVYVTSARKHYLCVKNSSYTNPSTFKSQMYGIKCYHESQYVYSIQSMSVQTVFGENTIGASTGSVRVTYYKQTPYMPTREIRDITIQDEPKTFDVQIDKYKSIKTATGNPATFDGAKAALCQVQTDIQAVQDLHGYDKPWPAGGGANILNVEQDRSISYSTTSRYMTITSSNATTLYNALSALPRGVNLFPRYDITVDGEQHAPSNYVVYFYLGSTQKATLTYVDGGIIPADATWDRIRVYSFSEDSATKTMAAFRVGRTQADVDTWTPYANICSIYGWSGCNILTHGKNWLDDSTLGTIDVTGTGTMRYGYAYMLLPAGTYTLSKLSGTSPLYLTNKTNGYSHTKIEAWPFTFTLSDASECTFRLTDASAAYWNYTDMQLEVGSHATAYEAYNAHIYPISWQTEAGTVYGGTLDVTTGLLTKTHKHVSVSSVSWTKSSGTNPYFVTYLSDVARIANWGTKIDAKSNIYVAATGNAASTSEDYCVFGTPNEDAIRVRDTRFSDASTFKTDSGGVIVYKLKTPTTYQLTPTEVRTLLGANTIFADTGNVTVQYSEIDFTPKYEATIKDTITDCGDVNLFTVKSYREIFGDELLPIIMKLNGNNDIEIGINTGIIDSSSPPHLLRLKQYINKIVNEIGVLPSPSSIPVDSSVSASLQSFVEDISHDIGLSTSASVISVKNISPNRITFSLSNEMHGGANIWDESWERGKYDGLGNKVAENGRIRCANKIPIVPGRYYYFTPNIAWIQRYDRNGNFVSQMNNSSPYVWSFSDSYGFITFYTVDQYGNTYNNDISVNYPSSITSYSPYSANGLLTNSYLGTGTLSMSLDFWCDKATLTVYVGTEENEFSLVDGMNQHIVETVFIEPEGHSIGVDTFVSSIVDLYRGLDFYDSYLLAYWDDDKWTLYDMQEASKVV